MSHYKILGISEKAAYNEIVDAYQKLMAQKNLSIEQRRDIQHAYQILSIYKLRNSYDDIKFVKLRNISKLIKANKLKQAQQAFELFSRQCEMSFLSKEDIKNIALLKAGLEHALLCNEIRVLPFNHLVGTRKIRDISYSLVNDEIDNYLKQGQFNEIVKLRQYFTTRSQLHVSELQYSDRRKLIIDTVLNDKLGKLFKDLDSYKQRMESVRKNNHNFSKMDDDEFNSFCDEFYNVFKILEIVEHLNSGKICDQLYNIAKSVYIYVRSHEVISVENLKKYFRVICAMISHYFDLGSFNQARRYLELILLFERDLLHIDPPLVVTSHLMLGRVLEKIEPINTSVLILAHYRASFKHALAFNMLQDAIISCQEIVSLYDKRKGENDNANKNLYAQFILLLQDKIDIKGFKTFEAVYNAAKPNYFTQRICKMILMKLQESHEKNSGYFTHETDFKNFMRELEIYNVNIEKLFASESLKSPSNVFDGRQQATAISTVFKSPGARA